MFKQQTLGSSASTDKALDPSEAPVPTPTRNALPQSGHPITERWVTDVWKPDSQAKECASCAAKFTLFLRKHHCRRCGDIFCENCSHYEFESQRVCGHCFRVMTEPPPMEPPPPEEAQPQPVKSQVAAAVAAAIAERRKTRAISEDSQPTTWTSVSASQMKPRQTPGNPDTSSPKLSPTDAAKPPLPDLPVQIEAKEVSPERNPSVDKTRPRASTTEFNSPVNASTINRRERQRRNIVLELLSTEKRYIADLTLVVNEFVSPAKKGKSKTLTADEVKGVFLNMGAQASQSDTPRQEGLISDYADEILAGHIPFMAKLESRISNWTDQSCIADIFLNHTDFLLDYEMYMASFNASKEVLEYLLAHREGFKLQKEKFECGQQTLLPLASFLILPIQRIPRYELFLKQLCQFTAPETAEAAAIAKAYQRIAQLMVYLNQQIMGVGNLKKILSIADALEGRLTVYKPGRRFLRSASMLWSLMFASDDRQDTAFSGQSAELSLLASFKYDFVLLTDTVICSHGIPLPELVDDEDEDIEGSPTKGGRPSVKNDIRRSTRPAIIGDEESWPLSETHSFAVGLPLREVMAIIDGDNDEHYEVEDSVDPNVITAAPEVSSKPRGLMGKLENNMAMLAKVMVSRKGEQLTTASSTRKGAKGSEPQTDPTERREPSPSTQTPSAAVSARLASIISPRAEQRAAAAAAGTATMARAKELASSRGGQAAVAAAAAAAVKARELANSGNHPNARPTGQTSQQRDDPDPLGHRSALGGNRPAFPLLTSPLQAAPSPSTSSSVSSGGLDGSQQQDAPRDDDSLPLESSASSSSISESQRVTTASGQPPLPFYPLALCLVTREVRWTLIANSKEQRQKWAADLRHYRRLELERERRERATPPSAQRRRSVGFHEKWERILQIQAKKLTLSDSHGGQAEENTSISSQRDLS